MEYKNKVSLGLKTHFKNKGVFKGTPCSDQSKQKISEGNSVSILQFNKDGLFIKKWKSIKEAALTLNINGSNIVEVCKNTRKTAGKFVWKYEKENNILCQ